MLMYYDLVMNETKRVTVLLAPNTHLKLKIRSAELGITMNNIMSDAIEMYLQKTINTLDENNPANSI